ncbi:MAG: hypothetical protein M1136_11460 [Chloroflexi bacterium]|nr:hypothetical protein [Chloroflexota bacterium]MCL5076240.1 hypothetical protein [Chloroflexota bacterium]
MSRSIANKPPEISPEVRGIIVLTPAESKRLIAKAVVTLPQVRWAREHGRLAIAAGTTNAFIAEEVLGKPLSKFDYAAGVIAAGQLAETPRERRTSPCIFRRGQVVNTSLLEIVKEFDGNDVFIKGGNAVDPQGYAGVLTADDTGGTIGAVLGILLARGSHLIVPVGLEKMVPSVIEASRKCGIFRFKYSLGSPVGLMPLVNATVITEIQSLHILSGVTATHVASGGIAGSEGSVVLVLEGNDEQVARAFELVRGIKGEKAIDKGAEVTTRPLRFSS